MAKAKGKDSKKCARGRQAPPPITFEQLRLPPETIAGYRKLAEDAKQAVAEGKRRARASEELQRRNDIRDGLLSPPWMENQPAAQSAPKNPRGAGRKREFNYEFILIEAAVYVVKNDLPKSVEELVHALQEMLGNKMPKDTLGKRILGPFFQRMKQALGR